MGYPRSFIGTHRDLIVRDLYIARMLSSLLSDDTHIIILDPMLPLRPLGPLGGGEGRGEMEDSRALVGTRLTLPAAGAVGPLPLRPEGRRGHVCTEQRNPA